MLDLLGFKSVQDSDEFEFHRIQNGNIRILPDPLSAYIALLYNMVFQFAGIRMRRLEFDKNIRPIYRIRIRIRKTYSRIFNCSVLPMHSHALNTHRPVSLPTVQRKAITKDERIYRCKSSLCPQCHIKLICIARFQRIHFDRECALK